MTDKVFWRDPYLAALDTAVADVRGDEVTLSATIFFAFSGGQESDSGSIAGLPVLEARAEGPEIVYRLPPRHGLVAGQAVRVEIDPQRRSRLMRLHFAAELVLELVSRRLPGARKVGAHIGAEKARIDFAWPENIAGVLAAVAAGVEALVTSDLPITSAFADAATQRRFWEVPGLARVPCGGTHPRRCGEVGAVTLKRRNVGRGIERIEVRLVDPASTAATATNGRGDVREA
jgi:Ser-tRNA(Ala) deacylase AlaX